MARLEPLVDIEEVEMAKAIEDIEECMQNEKLYRQYLLNYYYYYVIFSHGHFYLIN